MKTVSARLFNAIFLIFATVASAQVPPLLHYQGRIAVGGTNFDGSGQFKFALVNTAGTATFWSNDGSSVAGSQPAALVTLTVTRGLYAVLLGDTSIAGMTQVLPATVFTNGDVRLRVWFNDGVTGFQLLTPDQRIAAVGYAMMSANVPDGIITSNKLANGAVTTAKIADGAITASKILSNAITSAQLADDLDLGLSNVVGRLDVFATAAGTAAITLDGGGNSVITYGDDGLEQTRLSGPLWGVLQLRNSLSNNLIAVDLNANATSGGLLSLNNTNGSVCARLQGGNAGGAMTLYQTDGGVGVFADGDSNGAGLIDIRNTNASTMVRIAGDQGGRLETIGSVNLMETIGGDLFASIGKNGSGGGAFRTWDELGNQTTILGSVGTGGGGFLNVHMNASIWPGVVLDGDDGNSGTILLKAANDSTRMVLDAYNGAGAEISMRHTNGVETVEIIASEGGIEGGQILMRNKSGFTTIQFDGDASGNGSGYLRLYKGDGSIALTLEGDAAGEGKVTTQVLQITGGSDLSENFDVNAVHAALKPGMIVCIDPEKTGELVTSSKAYDRTVAGIVSGAGGVKPGMLMGQQGTKADGKHPVALTGRVYCYVDADHGAIRPGDLITTSDTPGHGMKVSDHARGQGSIIGKAMSSLEQGKGLILVLVSLQ